MEKINFFFFKIPCNNGISGVIRTEPSQETSTFHARTTHRIPGRKINSCQFLGRDTYRVLNWLIAESFGKILKLDHAKEMLEPKVSPRKRKPQEVFFPVKHASASFAGYPRH